MVGITVAFVLYMIVFTAVFLGHVGNYETLLNNLTYREMLVQAAEGQRMATKLMTTQITLMLGLVD